MDLIPCDLKGCGKSWIEAVVEETKEAGLPVVHYSWHSPEPPDASLLSVRVEDRECLLRFSTQDIGALWLDEGIRYRMTWYIMYSLSVGDYRLMPS